MIQVWLNGELRDAFEARIDPVDRGFTLGDGVFETLKVEEGQIRLLDRHLARLRHGLRVLGFAIAESDANLEAAIRDLLIANAMQNAALRLTVTRGPAPRGVLPPRDFKPTVLITAGPLPPELPAARVIVARGTRRNELSPLSRIKSLNYLDSILARREAEAAGADDALLLNGAGFVAESTASTVFLLVDGELVTPPVGDGALPGIARGEILRHGRAQEARVTVEMLARAQAGVLTNSLSFRGICAIEGRELKEERIVLF
jgi:branched-chain amino acid aminotransferase